MKINLPIRVVSESNLKEHWAVKAKRHRLHQKCVRLAYEKEVKEVKLPCVVTLTRLSPRLLDDDNLALAFKWIRDEISDSIFHQDVKYYIDKKGKSRALKGRFDNDSRVSYIYKQEKSKNYGIRIEISSLELTECQQMS